MKIIKYGHLPENKLYQTECSHCHTIFEFIEKEAKKEFTLRNETYLVIKCPLCSNSVWVFLN
jgi:hypothetical protein